MQILTPTPCCLYVKNLWQRIVSGFFVCLFVFVFNWYSLHAKLNSNYKAWSYKKKKKKQIKAYRKSLQKEPTVRCLLILDLKPLRS